MSKYVLAYHGGGMAEEPEEQAVVMQAWSNGTASSVEPSPTVGRRWVSRKRWMPMAP